MPQPSQPLPPEVAAALARGDKIEAIKRYRTQAGVGLKEAKEAVERHEAGARSGLPPSASSQVQGSLPTPSDVTTAISRGNKIEAIRLFREQTGSSLKEARDAVEALDRGRGAPGADMLAPGEVGRTSGVVKWALVLALLVAAVAYWILGTR